MATLNPPINPPARKNGLGITALVLGLVGILFGLLPIVGVVGIPLGVIGLGFAIPAMIQLLRHRAGAGFAIAGFVTSVVALILGIVAAQALASAADDVSRAVNGHTRHGHVVAAGGHVASVGKLDITDKSGGSQTTYRFAVQGVSDEPTATGKRVNVTVAERNVGDRPGELDLDMDMTTTLVGTNGKRYDGDVRTTLADDTVQPGAKGHDVLTFKVPKNVKPASVRLSEVFGDTLILDVK